MTQHYGKKLNTTPANAKANVSAAIDELIVVCCLPVL